jgi:hypothetical protein
MSVPTRDVSLLANRDFNHAYDIVVDYIDSRAEEQRQHRMEIARRAEAERRRRMQEDREYAFTRMLGLAGAELAGLTEVGDRYEVRWTRGDHTFRTVVDPSMRVHAAGICLAGTARDYDLATIVPVMEEAVRLGRYDMHFDDDGVQIMRYDPHDDWEDDDGDDW